MSDNHVFTAALEVDDATSKVLVARLKVAELNDKDVKVGPRLSGLIAYHRPTIVDLARMHSASYANSCLGIGEPAPTNGNLEALVALLSLAHRANVPVVLVGVSAIWREVLRVTGLEAIFLRLFSGMAPAFRREVYEYTSGQFSDELSRFDTVVNAAVLTHENSEKDFFRRYGMSSDEVRERFRETMTSKQYNQLSVAVGRGRLNFRQEKTWERFREAFPAAPADAMDIRFAMAARCSLHGVPTGYGWGESYALPLHHWEVLSQADDSTTRARFPFAADCPKCAAARLRWVASRIPDRRSVDPV